MKNKNGEKKRAKQAKNAPTTPHKKEFPSRVTNSVTKKTSYGLGWTTLDRMTPEINPFPSMLNIQSKLTLREHVRTVFRVFKVDPH